MADLNSLRRAAFLDRDGVINIDHGHVYRRDQFEFVPGVLEACATLAAQGFALVVVTNQSGIGRGMYTEADFHLLTAWMAEQFAVANAPLAGIYFCPHGPDDGCACRKPAPGLLLQAARELHLDLERSVLFGDKPSDWEAARAAGIHHRVQLGTDGIVVPAAMHELATARFRSLWHAVAGLKAMLAENARST